MDSHVHLWRQVFQPKACEIQWLHALSRRGGEPKGTMAKWMKQDSPSEISTLSSFGALLAMTGVNPATFNWEFLWKRRLASNKICGGDLAHVCLHMCGSRNDPL